VENSCGFATVTETNCAFAGKCSHGPGRGGRVAGVPIHRSIYVHLSAIVAGHAVRQRVATRCVARRNGNVAAMFGIFATCASVVRHNAFLLSWESPKICDVTNESSAGVVHLTSEIPKSLSCTHYNAAHLRHYRKHAVHSPRQRLSSRTPSSCGDACWLMNRQSPLKLPTPTVRRHGRPNANGKFVMPIVRQSSSRRMTPTLVALMAYGLRCEVAATCTSRFQGWSLSVREDV
jgi:hypothetical protein